MTMELYEHNHVVSLRENLAVRKQYCASVESPVEARRESDGDLEK